MDLERERIGVDEIVIGPAWLIRVRGVGCRFGRALEGHYGCHTAGYMSC